MANEGAACQSIVHSIKKWLNEQSWWLHWLVQHAIKDGCKWSMGDQIPQWESANSCSWMAMIFYHDRKMRQMHQYAGNNP